MRNDWSPFFYDTTVSRHSKQNQSTDRNWGTNWMSFLRSPLEILLDDKRRWGWNEIEGRRKMKTKKILNSWKIFKAKFSLFRNEKKLDASGSRAVKELTDGISRFHTVSPIPMLEDFFLFVSLLSLFYARSKLLLRIDRAFYFITQFFFSIK